MLSFDTAAELNGLVGREIGTSDWFPVDQEMIDTFAALTGDRQWIHVDVQRAKTEMPGGKTIAHGYLVLCVMSQMRIFTIEHYSKALNYGLDRLRFTGSVPSGSRIRLKQTLKALERVSAGYRLVITCVVEVENQERPSLVADQVLQYFDPK